ncbi:MAG: hypothetical protein ABW219_16780 [Ilumatobacteraceae bacterium]
MPDTAAPPHEEPGAVADRRCWRCLQMFPGDASLAPTAHEEWWVCAPCDASLFPGKRSGT